MGKFQQSDIVAPPKISMMFLAMAVDAYAFMPKTPSQVVPHSTGRSVAPAMETLDDLKVLAKSQNPVIGYFDPLELAQKEFWDQSNEATIGWLRHAEMKHGRVAMAGLWATSFTRMESTGLGSFPIRCLTIRPSRGSLRQLCGMPFQQTLSCRSS